MGGTSDEGVCAAGLQGVVDVEAAERHLRAGDHGGEQVVYHLTIRSAWLDRSVCVVLVHAVELFKIDFNARIKKKSITYSIVK